MQGDYVMDSICASVQHIYSVDTAAMHRSYVVHCNGDAKRLRCVWQ
jgi:hypothetical protein